MTGGLPTTVTRSAGLTLNWTGGNASDLVEIIGWSSTTTGTGTSAVHHHFVHLSDYGGTEDVHRACFDSQSVAGHSGTNGPPRSRLGQHSTFSPTLKTGPGGTIPSFFGSFVGVGAPSHISSRQRKKRTSSSRYTEGEVRFPFRVGWNSTASYVGLLAASFALALFISYIFGPQINIYAYDSMFRAYRPPPVQPESVVLAIDELTLVECGGIRGIRRPMAQALRVLGPAKPKVVAIDVILADQGNAAEDAALADALRATPNLVLSTELIDGGRIWEDPRPEFAADARLGHVSAVPDKDGVTRSILLYQHNARVQRGALALEAFLLSRGVATPRESLTFTRLPGGLASAEFRRET